MLRVSTCFTTTDLLESNLKFRSQWQLHSRPSPLSDNVHNIFWICELKTFSASTSTKVRTSTNAFSCNELPGEPAAILPAIWSVGLASPNSRIKSCQVQSVFPTADYHPAVSEIPPDVWEWAVGSVNCVNNVSLHCYFSRHLKAAPLLHTYCPYRRAQITDNCLKSLVLWKTWRPERV